MGTPAQILCLATVLVFIQGGASQIFHFPNGIEYEPSCGDQDFWSVEGTLQLNEQEVEFFDTKVILQVTNLITTVQICSIDLTACPVTPPLGDETCYCMNKTTYGYTIFVKRNGDSSKTGLMLQAAFKPRDPLNPTVLTANIGIMPHFNDAKQPLNVTYEVSNGGAHIMLPAQNVSVCRNHYAGIKICVANPLPGSTLKVSVAGQDTMTTHNCITLDRQYTFDDVTSYDVDFAYIENTTCARTERYTMNVGESLTGCDGDNDVCSCGTALPSCVIKSAKHNLPTSCAKSPGSLPRQVAILPDGMKVLCDTESNGGNWIIFQRRVSEDVDFYRNWVNYTVGFGDLQSNFWLGLENVYNICFNTTCEFRVDLKYQGVDYYAQYILFRLLGWPDDYKVLVGGYSGTAGDAFIGHNNNAFSTFDNGPRYSYAKSCHGGWWYFNGCYYSNLNGFWNTTDSTAAGMRWRFANGLGDRVVSFSEMKVRPHKLGGR